MGLFICGIASLFLLQRPNGNTGSISGYARDFNNTETRAVIRFSLQGKTPKEIHAFLIETFGEYAPSYPIVEIWVAQFKRGDFSTCVVPRCGITKNSDHPGDFNQIQELILRDRRIAAKSVAEQLGISREWVGFIVHED